MHIPPCFINLPFLLHFFISNVFSTCTLCYMQYYSDLAIYYILPHVLNVMYLICIIATVCIHDMMIMILKECDEVIYYYNIWYTIAILSLL